MERKAIKNMAKEILEGRRVHAAIVTLIVVVAYLIIVRLLEVVDVAIITTVLTSAVAAIYALVMGKFISELANSRGNVDVGEMIPSFTSFWKYWLVSFIYGLLLAFILVPITLTLVSAGIAGSVGLIIFMVICVIVVSFLLSMPLIFIPYILIENPEESISTTITDGFLMAFKNIGSIIMMYLSLIPWFLLIIVTLGIGTLYVSPYISTIFYVMYKEIRAEKIEFFSTKY